MDEEKRDELTEPEATEGKAKQAEEKQEELTPVGCIAMVLAFVILPFLVWHLALILFDGSNWVRHIIESVVLFVAFGICVGLAPDSKEEPAKEKSKEKAEKKDGPDLTPEGIARRRGEKVYSGVHTDLDRHMRVRSNKERNKRNPSICPNCGSNDTFVLGENVRPSALGALAGSSQAGFLGAAAGAAMLGKRRPVMMCRRCGRRWEVK